MIISPGSTLISLVIPSTEPATVALAAPGGFAWWYLDLVDGAGNGVVLIWSFGLPFLPGIRSSSGLPGARPALVLSGYEHGREAFYLFEEFDPADVDWDPVTGAGRFGDTRIGLTLTDSGVGLDITLRLDVPGSSRPLVGEVHLRGAARRGGTWGSSPSHQWMPITAATTATATFTGAWTTALAGRAYLDHNCGTVAMTRLGIRRWSWGRVALPGREVIWYELEPTDAGSRRGVVVEVAADGATRVVERALVAGPVRRTWTGVAAPRTLSFADPDGVQVDVHIAAPVDDAPFYQRSLVTATCGEASGYGTAEVVLPPRLDRAWFRPFVDMRVRNPRPANSPFLPLFTGAAKGRWARLFGFDAAEPR